MRVRPRIPAVIACLLTLLSAGCKRGEVDELKVQSQIGSVVVGIAPFRVTENSTNSFLFTMSRAQTTAVTLTWTITSLNAPTNGRFSTLSGQATFAAGTTTATAPIPLVNDAIYEGDLDYALTLSGVSAPVTVPVPTITFTLVDDEPPPSVRFAVASTQAPEASGPRTVNLVLSGASAYPVSVHLTVGGTAVLGDDYTITSGFNYTFAPGVTTQTVTINVVDDYLPEPDETVVLTLDPLTGTSATIGTPSAYTHTIVNDDFAPVVLDVTSSQANGAYKSGVIPVTVTFTRAVVVTGTPRLSLALSPIARFANYAAGSGTANLVFNYTIQPGDTAADLDYASTAALSLNGGTMKSTPDALDALLTLPTPGAAHALGGNKNILIDTTAPVVTNLTSTAADGPYSLGLTLPILIAFSEPILVTGSPRLALGTTPTVRFANYAGGSGSSTLTFNYVTQAGDAAADLDANNSAALGLNGGAMRDVAGNDAVLTVPTGTATGALAANKNILIDTTRPLVNQVNSPLADGAYPAGTTVPVRVTFSEAVFVGGTPRLTLGTTPTAQTVDYVDGSGTDTLTFNYAVQAGDQAAPLDEASTSALDLNGGSIVDVANNAASVTLPSPGTNGALGVNRAIVIDTAAPVVASLGATNPDGSYPVGSTIGVQVNFNEPVYVTGTPRLTLETGTVDRVIDYASGSGTSTLLFNYVVRAGDTSGDLDVTGPSALALNGGTIVDIATNAAVLTLPAPGAVGSLSATRGLAIDTTVPHALSVTSTKANGAYPVGTAIDVVVNFSEAVTVTGSPQLILRTGSGQTTALALNGGSGSSGLTFRYVVATGDVSPDLDYDSTNSFHLNGGTVRDAAANDAVLTLPAPGTAGSLGANKNIVIDTTAPVVTAVSSSLASGSYPAGVVIPVTVQFSENVFVAGSPQLALAVSPAHRTATYASGSGTSVLRFNYVVQAGDTAVDLDYVSTGALGLNGGTLRDVATNAAVLTLAAPGTSGSLGLNRDIVIDTTAPTITSLTASTGDGFYKAGGLVTVVIHFTEPVNVSGLPQLTLETGTTDAVINYQAGSGTSDLSFNYTVQNGDVSRNLDVTGTNALSLSNGTIGDAATNAANLTLPAPGATGSLGVNQHIVIDTTAPMAPGAVNDGTWVTSLNQTPPLTWGTSTDATSGVDHYDLAIGTSAGGTSVLAWTAVGNVTSRTQYSLSLTEGTSYVVSVRAVDRAGNISAITSGDGFKADVTPPTAPSSIDDGTSLASVTSTPPLTWSASSDGLSGLSGYQIAIGTSAGLTDVVNWSNVGLNLTTTLAASLTEGSTYFASVRALDVAGNIGPQTSGDGWVIGWIPQAFVKPNANSSNNVFGTATAVSGNTLAVSGLGGNASVTVYVRSGLTWAIQQTLTPSAGNSGFGKALALDADTLVVGAPNDNYNSSTIGTAPPGVNLFPQANSGAAYIYVRSNGNWTLQAYAKASNSAGGLLYGSAVALSGDTVVVGAPGESSNTTGTNANSSTNTSNTNAGAAYVLLRAGTTWTNQAYLKAATSKSNVKFGSSVAVNGETALVGTPADDAPGSGVLNGSGGANATGAGGSGAAYVFKRAGTAWAQEAYIKASNVGAGDQFGTSVALSGDLALVGAPNEASDQRTITNGAGGSASDAAPGAGAAYVFARSGSAWAQSAYLKAANADANDLFGSSVGIDGALAVVGAPGEASAQKVVSQLTQASADNSAASTGAGYLFRQAGGTWSELAYLKAPNSGASDLFGVAAAISGTTLSFGATGEDSNVTGVTNGSTASTDNSSSNSGAAYLFVR